MNKYTIIGIIIFVLLFLGIPAYIFFENVYWMIKCLRHGGDWRYYADRIFATIFVTLAIIGIALLTYGSNI